MRRFAYEFGDREWPAGKGVLQVYAMVDLQSNPELRELVRGVREVVAASGAPLSPGWPMRRSSAAWPVRRWLTTAAS